MPLQAEFDAHDDEVDLEDFCAIMERHTSMGLVVKESAEVVARSSDNAPAVRRGANEERASYLQADIGSGNMAGTDELVVTREEVVSNLIELFKEVQCCRA